MENLLATIHVAIVEDERRTREGLRELIEGSEGFLCMNAWGSMEDALASEWTTPLNVILLDLGLPGMSGIELYTQLPLKDNPRSARRFHFDSRDRLHRASIADLKFECAAGIAGGIETAVSNPPAIRTELDHAD